MTDRGHKVGEYTSLQISKPYNIQVSEYVSDSRKDKANVNI